MEADPCPQPSPHFAHNEINALPLNGQHAVTAITALWLWRSTAFRWLRQPIGRHLMSNVVEQVIQRHPEVKNEGIPEPCGWIDGYLRRNCNRDYRLGSLPLLGLGLLDWLQRREILHQEPVGEDVTTADLAQ